MFTCTRGKGFSMRFDNGLTLSVQWGAGNYCDNKMMDDLMATRQRYLSCPNAEIRVIDDDNNDYTYEVLRGHSVIGYVTTDQVATMMTKVAGYRKMLVQ